MLGAGGSEEQVEIPWLHNDPLSELQVADSPFYPIAPTSVEDGDDVSDAVLDEACAALGSRASRASARSACAPRPGAVQQRGSQGEPIRGGGRGGGGGGPGLSESFEETRDLAGDDRSLVPPARLDSGVLGEDDRRLVDRAPTYNRSVLIASSSFKLWLVFRLLIRPLLSYPLFVPRPAPTLLL